MTPPEHILLVDDNLKILRIYQETLEEAGYRVSVAEGGATALRFLAHLPAPGLIIVDCFMPHMSGEELIRRIREEFPEIAARVPILGTSSLGAETPFVRTFVSLVTEYRERPESLEDLVAFVARHFSGKRPADPELPAALRG